MKRKLCFIMATAMVVTGLAGCGSADKTPKEEGPTPSATTPAKAEILPWDKAPKVTVVKQNTFDVALGKTGDNIVDNPYTRYIHEKTGIRLEIVPAPSTTNEFHQVLAVKVAGGEQIDLISWSDLSQSWIDSGTTIQIDSIMEKNKALIPNILKTIPKDAWEPAEKIDVSTGKTVRYGIPTRNTLGKPMATALYLRKDWLDKLNLSMPKTTDDLTKVLKAFTENDPDGNGKKDTSGLFTSKGFTMTNTLMQLWGVDTWREDWVGEKLIPSAHTDKARAAYKTLSVWYKNNYIDVEGVTDGKVSETKLLNGKIGGYVGPLATITKYWDQMDAAGQKDAKWAMVNTQLISSFDNKPYYFRENLNKDAIVQFCATSKESNYPNILKLLDWMHSEEGTTFTSYGLEGREHKVENGKKVRNMQYINVDQKSYLNAYQFARSYATVFDDIFLSDYVTANSKELAKAYFDASTKGTALSWKAVDIKFAYPALETFKTYPDYRKGIETYMGKFALGELDVNDDKVWAKYLEDSDKYGFQKILDEALPLWKNRK